MSTFKQIDAVLKSHGWEVTYEAFRYKSNGRLVGFDAVMRAMPDDILEDVVAAYAEDRFEKARRAAATR